MFENWEKWLINLEIKNMPEDYANVLTIECPECEAHFEIFKGIYATYDELQCTKKCGEKNPKDLFKVIKEFEES